MKMKIHREGKNILLILFIILALLNLPVYLWIKITWLAYLIHAASIIFFFLVVNFFRSPKRHFKGNPKNAIVAPADGVVVVLEEVLEDEYFHDKRMQVSIFMNIFKKEILNCIKCILSIWVGVFWIREKRGRKSLCFLRHLN